MKLNMANFLGTSLKYCLSDELPLSECRVELIEVAGVLVAGDGFAVLKTPNMHGTKFACFSMSREFHGRENGAMDVARQNIVYLKLISI